MNPLKNQPMKYFGFTLLIALFTTNPSIAQHEDFKARIQAFVEAHAADYDKKSLNISDAPIGDIEGQRFQFSDKFVLRGKKKAENSIGNNVKPRYFLNFYAYEDASDRDYAIRHWLKNFVDGGSIRPGITTRNYQNLSPMIIIINEIEVCVLSYSCHLYDYDAYKEWRTKMLQYFGNEKSVVIEAKCNGPVEWTQNAPDPKDRRWK
jgi:hypothetical protein